MRDGSPPAESGDGMSGRRSFESSPRDAPRLDVLVAQQLDISRNQAATLIANGHVLVGGRRERASYRARAGGANRRSTFPRRRAVRSSGESIPLDGGLRGRRRARRRQAGGDGRPPGARQLVRDPRQRPEGAGQARCPAGPTRAARGSSTAWTRRRPGCCSWPRRTARTECLGPRSRPARSSGDMRRCPGGTSPRTGSRSTSRSPAIRETESAWQSSVQDGRRGQISRGSRASTPWICCGRTCIHGRTHQIRVHLASIGHPVVGDDTYGGGGGRKLVDLPPRRHFLHAAWLIFRHPVSGETVDLRSPLPEELHRALVAAAGPDVPIAADPDPLEFFGFYRVDP